MEEQIEVLRTAYEYHNKLTKGTLVAVDKFHSGHEYQGFQSVSLIVDGILKGRATPIIFIGQDLAFIDNKHHTETFTDIYGESNEVSPYSRFETVLGVNGDQLYTNSGLLSFKRRIERTIDANPQITFYNASKGAKIEGTIERDMSEIFA